MRKTSLQDFSLQQLQEWSGEKEYTLALELVRKKKVELELLNATELRAKVIDGETHIVECDDDYHNSAGCTCFSEAYPCEHVVAMLIANHEQRGASKVAPSTENEAALIPASVGAGKKTRTSKERELPTKGNKIAKIVSGLEATAREKKVKLHPVERAIQGTNWRDLVEFLMRYSEVNKSIVKELEVSFEKDSKRLRKLLEDKLDKVNPDKSTKLKPKQCLSEIQIIHQRARALDPDQKFEVDQTLAVYCLAYSRLKAITEQAQELFATILQEIQDYFAEHDRFALRVGFILELCSELEYAEPDLELSVIDSIVSFVHNDEERIQASARLNSPNTRSGPRKDVLQRVRQRIESAIVNKVAVLPLLRKYATSIEDYQNLIIMYSELGRMQEAVEVVNEALDMPFNDVYNCIALVDRLVPWFVKERNAGGLMDLFKKQLLKVLQDKSPISWHIFNYGSEKLLSIYKWSTFSALVSLYPEFLKESEFEVLIDSALSQKGAISLDFYRVAQRFPQLYKERVQSYIVDSLLKHWNEGNLVSKAIEYVKADTFAVELLNIYVDSHSVHQLFELVHHNDELLVLYHKVLGQDYSKDLQSALKNLIEKNLRIADRRSDRRVRECLTILKQLLTSHSTTSEEWDTYILELKRRFRYAITMLNTFSASDPRLF